MVEAFHGGSQDLRAQVRLIVIDAEPPDSAQLGRLERRGAARTGNGEDDDRAAIDLLVRKPFALVVAEPGLDVVDEHASVGHRVPRTCLVAGEQPFHGRNG